MSALEPQSLENAAGNLVDVECLLGDMRLVLRHANAFTVALTFRSALADLKVGATKD